MVTQTSLANAFPQESVDFSPLMGSVRQLTNLMDALSNNTITQVESLRSLASSQVFADSLFTIRETMFAFQESLHVSIKTWAEPLRLLTLSVAKELEASYAAIEALGANVNQDILVNRPHNDLLLPTPTNRNLLNDIRVVEQLAETVLSSWDPSIPLPFDETVNSSQVKEHMLYIQIYGSSIATVLILLWFVNSLNLLKTESLEAANDFLVTLLVLLSTLQSTRISNNN
jgi:hypothetical protein